MAATGSSQQTPIEEELTPQQFQNFTIGKQKKDEADSAFKDGNPKKALASYHQSLLYFRGLNKQSPIPGNQDAQDKPKNEIDEMLEKVYSNMSACHLRLENWSRTIETAEKALALNKDNLKAMFRKGKGLGEMGYFEKAEVILNGLLGKNPADDPIIKSELERLRAKDKERERKHNQKLKGFLSRSKDILSGTEGPASDPPEQLASAKIEEIKEDPEQSTSAEIEEIKEDPGQPTSAKIEEIKDE